MSSENRKNITEEQKDEMARLYSSGMRKIDIANKLGVSRSVVSKYTKRKQYKTIADGLIAEVRSKYLSGMSQCMIATELGFSQGTISRMLVGVEKRKRGIRAPLNKTMPKPIRKKIKLETKAKPLRAYNGEELPSQKLDSKICKTKPAIKPMTRKVRIRRGLEVYASINEPEESVVARWEKKLKNR